jgi:hypothetical protein
MTGTQVFCTLFVLMLVLAYFALVRSRKVAVQTAAATVTVTPVTATVQVSASPARPAGWLARWFNPPAGIAETFTKGEADGHLSKLKVLAPSLGMASTLKRALPLLEQGMNAMRAKIAMELTHAPADLEQSVEDLIAKLRSIRASERLMKGERDTAIAEKDYSLNELNSFRGENSRLRERLRIIDEDHAKQLEKLLKVVDELVEAKHKGRSSLNHERLLGLREGITMQLGRSFPPQPANPSKPSDRKKEDGSKKGANKAERKADRQKPETPARPEDNGELEAGDSPKTE